MMQRKDQVSVLRLVTPVALVCLILSLHAICQEAPIDRSITVTVDRSITFSAAPGVAVVVTRNQSHTAMSVSPRTSSPVLGANGSSSPTAPKAQAGSSGAHTFAVHSSSVGSPVGAYSQGRMPGALGFNSSVSVGSGSAMGFTARAKSSEYSPVQVVAAASIVGSISDTSGSMFQHSRQRGFDFPSSMRHSSIRGNSSPETQKSGARKACGNSSSCIAKQKNRQTKHGSVWNVIQPQQNQK